MRSLSNKETQTHSGSGWNSGTTAVPKTTKKLKAVQARNPNFPIMSSSSVLAERRRGSRRISRHRSVQTGAWVHRQSYNCTNCTLLYPRRRLDVGSKFAPKFSFFLSRSPQSLFWPEKNRLNCQHHVSARGASIYKLHFTRLFTHKKLSCRACRTN